MRSPRQGAIPSDLGDLIDALDDFETRLRTLEAPSGEALSSTVAKLQSLVANIQAQLDAWTASRWTNAQITTEITNGINSRLAGSVTIGGNLGVVGSFSAPDAVAFNITGVRRTAWLEDATGRLGYAPSSVKTKAAIRPAGDELLGILDVEPKSFIYRAEIARRTRLRINDGMDYTPRRELGLLAQELHDAGLGAFVIYGSDGEAEGIEYGMLVVPLLAALRAERAERVALDDRVRRLESLAG